MSCGVFYNVIFFVFRQTDDENDTNHRVHAVGLNHLTET